VRRYRSVERGITYTELTATVMMMMVIVFLAVPTARKVQQRRREGELKRALTHLRRCIDRYTLYAQEGGKTPDDRHIEPQRPPFPKKLDDLLEEHAYIGTVSTSTKFKACRSIPKDPFTESGEWGLLCQEDEPDSTNWCGRNIYDVYSKSTAKALDGRPYRDW
jgi:general secretion pathway protein G